VLTSTLQFLFGQQRTCVQALRLYEVVYVCSNGCYTLCALCVAVAELLYCCCGATNNIAHQKALITCGDAHARNTHQPVAIATQYHVQQAAELQVQVLEVHQLLPAQQVTLQLQLLQHHQVLLLLLLQKTIRTLLSAVVLIVLMLMLTIAWTRIKLKSNSSIVLAVLPAVAVALVSVVLVLLLLVLLAASSINSELLLLLLY
jgi:hypothetical protein